MYFNSGLEDLPDYLYTPNLMNKAHASREHFGLFLDVYLSLSKCPAFQDPSI